MEKLGSSRLAAFLKALPWGGLALGLALGISAMIGLDVAMRYTSTNEFCAYCHQDNAVKEWRESPHYDNPKAVTVDCARCHIPSGFFPKVVTKVRALGDAWAFMQGEIDTPEKYEARRLHMARKAWARMEASDSRECKQCHRLADIDNPEKPFVKTEHLKPKNQGKACIKCHKGVAHWAPEEPETAQ